MVLGLFPFLSIALTYNFSNYSVADGLPQSKVYQVIQSSKGFIWMATEGGLSRFDGINFQNYSTSEGLAESIVTAICEDDNGDLWIGHMSGAVTLFRGDSFQIVKFDGYEIEHWVVTILKDLKGQIWISTDGSGAIMIKDPKGKFIVGENVKVFLGKEGLGEVVQNTGLDNDGNIWFFLTDGTKFYNVKSGEFEHFKYSKGEFLTSVADDGRGHLFFGSVRDNMLLKYTKSSNEVTLLGELDGLVANWIPRLYSGTDGTLWIGTWGSGIIGYKDSKFEYLTMEEGLSNNKIRSIIEDREKNIWIGTNAGGISYYKGKLFETYSAREFLRSNNIWTIHPQENGDLLLGTNHGLASFDPVSKTYSISTIDVN
ncbi:MAG: hypothetical protein IH946_10115, partial [Bacteroidetes bacterium]|nr:hypothetical protein [Bacteroidota bacterium]